MLLGHQNVGIGHIYGDGHISKEDIEISGGSESDYDSKLTQRGKRRVKKLTEFTKD